MRSIGARTYQNLENAIALAHSQVSFKDIRNWFTHSCYVSHHFEKGYIQTFNCSNVPDIISLQPDLLNEVWKDIELVANILGIDFLPALDKLQSRIKAIAFVTIKRNYLLLILLRYVRHKRSLALS